MNIQIGLPCEPQWLCDLIAIGLGILLVVGVVALIKVIIREQRKRK